MPAVLMLVSITIPKKVTWVDRPSILEVLTGALMFSYSRSIACRLFKHSVELGEPALRNCLDGRHPMVMLEGPMDGISSLNKQEECRSKAKWQASVNVKMAPSLDTNKVPVLWSPRNE